MAKKNEIEMEEIFDAMIKNPVPNDAFDRAYWNENKPYFNQSEKDYYEGFVQPIVQSYKLAKMSKWANVHFHGALPKTMKNSSWRVYFDKMGPYKELFVDTKGRRTYVSKGEVETILIIAREIVRLKLSGRTWDDIGKMLGCHERWLKTINARMVQIASSETQMSQQDFVNEAIMELSQMKDQFKRLTFDSNLSVADLTKIGSLLLDIIEKLRSFITPIEEQGSLKLKLSPDEIEITGQRVMKMLEERKKDNGD